MTNPTIPYNRCSRRRLLRWSPLQIKGKFQKGSLPGLRLQKSPRVWPSSVPTSRCAAKESKKIEQAGGYQFAQQTVPGGFNFGEFKPFLTHCPFNLVQSFQQGCIFSRLKCFVSQKRPFETFRVRQRRLSQVGAGELEYLKQTM